MRRNKYFDCIIAALIGAIATGAAIYIILVAAVIMNPIGSMLR